MSRKELYFPTFYPVQLLIYKADTDLTFQIMKDQITVTDARSLPPGEQEELRKKAVLAVESGRRIGEVSDLFGVTRQSVGKRVREYREKGTDALRSRRRGHEEGRGDRRDRKPHSARGGAILEKVGTRPQLPEKKPANKIQTR